MTPLSLGAKVFKHILRIDNFGPTLVNPPRHGTLVHLFGNGYETICMHAGVPRLGSYARELVTCEKCLNKVNPKPTPVIHTHYINNRWPHPECYTNSPTRVYTTMFTNVTCPECRKFLLKEVMIPRLKNRGKK